MIYFTSDEHFGHKNVLTLCNRPFDSLEEMEEAYIARWNERVKPEDTVYILGDFAFRASLDRCYQLLSTLNGKKHLIRGNHDKRYDPQFFESIHDLYELKVNNKSVVLCHYPLEEWPGYFRGAYHLHGHQHNQPEYNQLMRDKGLRRYDVGVDANKGTPVSLDEIISFFE